LQYPTIKHYNNKSTKNTFLHQLTGVLVKDQEKGICRTIIIPNGGKNGSKTITKEKSETSTK